MPVGMWAGGSVQVWYMRFLLAGSDGDVEAGEVCGVQEKVSVTTEEGVKREAAWTLGAATREGNFAYWFLAEFFKKEKGDFSCTITLTTIATKITL